MRNSNAPRTRIETLAGDGFRMGVLLYDGDEILPVGNGILAAPVSTLWGK